MCCCCLFDHGFFQKLSKGVKTVGWNKQYVGQMIVQNWPSRWFKWFKNVSRVCASWRERACPDRTSAQSSLEPHSSARSCWSPAKNDCETSKQEEKQFSVCGFYLVLLLVQEERVASFESLELFLFRKKLDPDHHFLHSLIEENCQ